MFSTPCDGVRVARSWRSGNLRTATVSAPLILPPSGRTESGCMLNVGLRMWFGVQGGERTTLDTTFITAWYIRRFRISPKNRCDCCWSDRYIYIRNSFIGVKRATIYIAACAYPRIWRRRGSASSNVPQPSSQSMHVGASYEEAFVQSALRTRTVTRRRPSAADLALS